MITTGEPIIRNNVPGPGYNTEEFIARVMDDKRVFKSEVSVKALLTKKGEIALVTVETIKEAS